MACLISFKDGQTEGWNCACKIGKIPWEEVFVLSLYHMAQSSGRFNRHLERMLVSSTPDLYPPLPFFLCR